MELNTGTGFFDKNGIELRIGDIIEDSRGLNHVVKFGAEYIGKYIEVIGNIYENPELLESKNSLG